MDCTTGACRCSGVNCDVGVSCAAFYEDLDQDGSGNPKKMLPGCVNKPPLDVNGHAYITNSDDCDDTDVRAHPGQTQFFNTQRNGGGWDFNCDSKEERQYKQVATPTCQNCGWSSTSLGCMKCTQLLTIATFGLECGTSGCDVVTASAFKDSVTCGGKSTLYGCYTTPKTCTTILSSTANTIQGCR
jgi:hypothetical protein